MTDVSARLATALAARYTVERELGHGGMATVYLAHDVKHGRAVAVKVLRPELAQAVTAERFLREISIAARLQSPHVLPLFDSGESDGLLYYVMPYVEGESLRDQLARQGALAPSEAMRLLRDIVDGLAHAHRHGVVHRDIKPDNVMIAERHAIVVDFGVAKAVSDATAHHDLTSIGISLGTPAYMAPEQVAADANIDHRADIYAVGVLAYELLAGRPPFAGGAHALLAAHIANAPEPLSTVRPDVPPAIAQIVMKCLEKDPAARFQTADELLGAIESLTTPIAITAPMSRARRFALGAVAATVFVALTVAAFIATGRIRRDRWVHRTALPELVRLIDASDADSAFDLALRIQTAAPEDSALNALWPRFTVLRVVKSEPAGAKVYRASVPDTSHWYYVGTTPTDTVRVPVDAGLYRYEKPGLRTVYAVGTAGPLAFMDSVGAPDAEMNRIAGGVVGAFLVGTDGRQPIRLGEYRMDRFEITNRQFKVFVDAGGYRDRSYWEHAFRDAGRILTAENALARFVDRTGRPGPATWEGGDFPSGQSEMPVGGVSWYEAAAYAKFAKKSLPTIYHWARAANITWARWIVPVSNLSGSGPLPVGTLRGVSPFGISDMAGNVREWCMNDAGRDQRFILGGGWSDPAYAFVDAYAQPPMDRAPINGIRLAKYAPGEQELGQASGPVVRAFTDYTREAPVSDAVFRGFTSAFDFDASPLEGRIETSDTTEQWVRQRVSFNAAYGGEREYAWILLPRHGKAPYQTVVHFPGSSVIGAASTINSGVFSGRASSVVVASSPAVREVSANFIVRSGRAFVLPIYKSTYERSDSLRSDVPDPSVFWRDHVVMWGKDFRRALDYLSTRAEFDTTKFAYFGYSWGGNMGGIIPAIEPRIKTSVLYVAGLTMERGRPEVDPLNFLPRIRVPVLMLNGKYDYYFPVETAQRPFFRYLGTPVADKRHVVYEGGHDVPRTQLIAETLAWLDKYLGPVR